MTAPDRFPAAPLLLSLLLAALPACGGSPEAPAEPSAPLPPATVGRKVFLLNRDRDAILVDGEAGSDFTNLRGELPRITELRCGERTRRALVQRPGSEIAFPGALPHDGELVFGVGFTATAAEGDPPFRLTVAARAADGGETVLWRERRTAPAAEAERRWDEGRADVSALPSGDLLLRVEVPVGSAPPEALPAWGDPTLRGEGRKIEPRRSDRRSVVVFLVDTLRADRVSLLGHERPTTPRLDALADEALVFENAFAPSSWTKASVASLFTSRLPSRHGAEDYPHRLPDSVTTVAEVFRGAGYATAAIGANLWIFYPHFAFGRGFDDFVQTFEAEGWGGPAADAVVDEAIDWLERHRDERFFLYVHVMDPHSPYRPPGGPGAFQGAPYAGSITGETRGPGAFTERAPDELTIDDRRYLDALYDAEIAFADAQMGRLVDAMRALGLWEESTFVLLSDHGEEFGEHGGWEHSTTLYDEQLRVPLVVVPPASADLAPRRVETPVSLVDVAPALLALAGVDARGTPFAERGRGLLGLAGSAPLLVSELHLQDRRWVAVREGDTKLIVRAGGTPREEVYRLDRDPLERDAAPGDADPDRLARLRARADEILALGGADGVHLELWGGGEACAVRGALRADRPMSDVNPRETEYSIEGERFVGDEAYFADDGRRTLVFELRVGPDDERDYVVFRAPEGTRLALDAAFLGADPDVAAGPGGERGSLPLEVVVGDEDLVAPSLPPPPGGGPLLRIFVLRPEDAELDAEQLERVRALGYGD